VVSLWHSSSRTCVIFRGIVYFLDRYQTSLFLAVTGLWGSGKVSLFASKILSDVVVTSQSWCVFLYLFSSSNISSVRFVWHLQDWWCVGKRETSFPVNKFWLIYLLPSLWPLTVIKTISVYHYCFCFINLFYNQISSYGPPLSVVFSKWPGDELTANPWNSNTFLQRFIFQRKKTRTAESPNESLRITNLKQKQMKAKRLKEIFEANQLEKRPNL